MKNVFLIALAAIFMASCTKQALVDPNGGSALGEVLSPEKSNNGAKKETFEVRIETLAEGDFVTPFAPGVWLVQKKNSAPIFMDGAADFGDGLEALAEDGSPGMLNDALVNHPKVRDHAMFNTPVGAAGPAPIFPGDAYEFSFSAKPNDYLNFATMFIQSNDLFVGPDAQGIPLFDEYGDPISGDVTAYLSIWDAGTEVNEEPGNGPNQAPQQSGPNTGPDENGVVQIVDDGYTYPSVSEIIKVTITVQ